jgi:FdrA protein
VRDAAALGADLALVSVPGEHAFVEALDALRAGLHVLVFSDNVPLGHEVALKREAADAGLLMMGPDAGTAIVSGVGLGFANVVAPGPVGVVAASGTGAQQLTCLLDDAGIGVSHVLGVGGRDLSAAVGGLATRQALTALDADPATELIVLLSKPPDPTVADQVRQVVAGLDTPSVVAFVGRGELDLTAAAAEVAHALGRSVEPPRWWLAPQERHGHYPELRGLFAGGTLCDEAMAIAAKTLGPIRSNVPLDPDWTLTDGLDTAGNVCLDLGEDEFTRGRPHPMIDQQLRVERIAAEAKRPGGRVLLLDVVLGHGAHPDPASELAPAIAGAIATSEDLAVVVSLCATASDPQGRDRQAEAFVEAGASVHLSNAHAAHKAVELHAEGS